MAAWLLLPLLDVKLRRISNGCAACQTTCSAQNPTQRMTFTG